MRLIAVILLICACACAQQDDVAAAARANKQGAQSAPDRVYTNDDLGYGNPADNEKKALAKKELAKAARKKPDRSKQIIQQVLQQRAQIGRLEGQLGKLKTIQAERAALETPPTLTPDLCAAQPERCESRGAFLNDIRTTQHQLDAAHKKLNDIQESARKDGYPDSVIDPED